jgi:hypothetical protein
MAFFKKKDKKDLTAVQRSSSMGQNVLMMRPKTKSKAVAEYYSIIDEICQILVQNEFKMCGYLLTLEKGLTSIPRLMNSFYVFRQQVREEYHNVKGDTSLLLRNTSDGVKWMKGIVEAESADMVLLEKKVLWLLNKYCRDSEDGATSPVRHPISSPVSPSKKSSFLAPSVGIHQVIIQKDETPEGSGLEWCDNDEAIKLNGLDPEVKRLAICILGILHCCSQIPILCRLCAATSDEVKKLQRPTTDDEGSPCLSRDNSSNSDFHRENSFSESSESLPPDSPASSKKSKDKKKKCKASASTSKRSMRRKCSEEEKQLFGWTVTNVILLHFAVPVVASRSIKYAAKPEKRIVKFSKLVARTIMKVAANSEYCVVGAADFVKYNPVIDVLHKPYLNFCQDTVENGLSYPVYAPEIKRSSLHNLRNDMASLVEQDEETKKIHDLCELALRKGASTKKVNRQLSSEPMEDCDLDTLSSTLSEWRSPSIIDDSQLENDDYTYTESISSSCGNLPLSSPEI